MRSSLRCGGAHVDVVGPPPGGLFGETNDNSVALLLTHGTARVLLAGDAEAREEEYMAFGPYTGPLTSSTSRYHTHSDPRFRALPVDRATERLELAGAWPA